MEPTDHTLRVLQGIRDEIRGLRGESREQAQELREEVGGLRVELRSFQEHATARFEAIEITLRDLAEQMVMLGRGIKVAIEHRSNVEGRVDDHERRLADLEARGGR